MGTGHGHDASNAAAPRRIRLLMVALVVPMMIATAVALLVWWPRDRPAPDRSGNPDRHLATVTEVRQRTCTPEEVTETPTGIRTTRCGTVSVRVDDGPDKGRIVVTQLPDGPGAPRVEAGAKVVVFLLSDPGDPSSARYTIADRQRGFPLVWLAVLAAVAIVGFARWRGLAALAGLGVSFGVLLLFVLPAITAGKPPLPVAVVGAATIMFVVLYLTHGVSVRTSVAVLGTLLSLILTGLLGQLAAAATFLTGYGSEDASTLSMFYQNVDVYGLLLAGIIIGSLGVLDDVTVTQAATVAELAAADPAMSRRRLYQAASRVGRAHIASVVNTIVLAYAGASLPVMLLIVGSGRAVDDTLTTEFVAQEVVRSAVSTIGLVAAVPITTALAAMVAVRRREPADQPAVPQPKPATPSVPAMTGRHRSDDPWTEPEPDWPDGRE